MKKKDFLFILFSIIYVVFAVLSNHKDLHVNLQYIPILLAVRLLEVPLGVIMTLACSSLSSYIITGTIVLSDIIPYVIFSLIMSIIYYAVFKNKIFADYMILISFAVFSVFIMMISDVVIDPIMTFFMYNVIVPETINNTLITLLPNITIIALTIVLLSSIDKTKY